MGRGRNSRMSDSKSLEFYFLAFFKLLFMLLIEEKTVSNIIIFIFSPPQSKSCC